MKRSTIKNSRTKNFAPNGNGRRIWQELGDMPATSSELGAILNFPGGARHSMCLCSAWLSFWKCVGKVVVVGQVTGASGRLCNLYARQESQPARGPQGRGPQRERRRAARR